jgi:tRNA-splicing endonuclease subunit Sen54
MADASEDFLSPNSTKSTPRPTSRSAHPPSPSDDIDADEENEEGILDFASLLPGPKAGSKPPSRGIKDFEPHGTQLQSSALAASRAAMHAVLSEERVHGGNHVDRAVWDGEFGGGAWVSRAGGNWSRVVGRSRRIEILDEDKQDEGEEEEDAQKEKKKKRFMARLWLLPEEALWLVERGTVDMRFPARPGEDEDGGLPMSLQGAYAVFLGEEKEGGLTLEKYTVFQYLKRAGYVVVRAEDNWNSIPKGDGQNRQAYDWNSLWARVFGKNLPNRGQSQVRMGNGPLVKPGLYRDYGTHFLSTPSSAWLTFAKSLDISSTHTHPTS